MSTLDFKKKCQCKKLLPQKLFAEEHDNGNEKKRHQPHPPPPTIKPSLNSVTTADVQGQTLVFAIKKEMNLLDFDK